MTSRPRRGCCRSGAAWATGTARGAWRGRHTGPCSPPDTSSPPSTSRRPSPWPRTQVRGVGAPAVWGAGKGWEARTAPGAGHGPGSSASLCADLAVTASGAFGVRTRTHGGTSPHPAAPPAREERDPGLRRRDHPGAGTRRRVRGEQGGRYARGRGAAVEGHRARGSIFGAEVSGCEGALGACSPRQLPELDKAGHTAELGTANQHRRGVTGSGVRGELPARLCLPHVLGCGRAGLNRGAQRRTRGSLPAGSPLPLPSSGTEPEREQGRSGSRVPAQRRGPPLPAGAGGCLAAARRQRRLLSPP